MTELDFYLVKYKYPTDSDKGVKWVNAEWLINAISVSDAETKLYEHESKTHQVGGSALDLKVQMVRKTKIEKVIVD